MYFIFCLLCGFIFNGFILEEKCSFCLNFLVCNADDILNCDCQKVELLQETVDFLYKKTNHGCLCNSCLLKFDAWIKYSLAYDFVGNASVLRPEYFYIENGLYVFTPLYHLHKGKCCGNGCRHCVYRSKL